MMSDLLLTSRALVAAVLASDAAAVELCLDNGADINVSDKQVCEAGLSPLMWACARGDRRVIGLLLHHGAADALEVRTPDGLTPLMIAAHMGHIEVAQQLIGAGADPRALVVPSRALEPPHDRAQVAADLAANRGHGELAALLRDAAAAAPTRARTVAINNQPDAAEDPGAPDFAAEVFDACQSGEIELPQEWLDNGGDVDWADEQGVTLLMGASFSGHAHVVQLLLAHDASADEQMGVGGNAALTLAAANGHLDCVVQLLDAGADPRLTTHSGYSALKAADRNGHQEISQLLLSATQAASWQVFRLEEIVAACQHGDEVEVSDWIKEGGDVNARLDDATLLMHAAHHGQERMVVLLCARGATVDECVQLKGNCSALMLASGVGHLNIVRRLLKCYIQTLS